MWDLQAPRKEAGDQSGSVDRFFVTEECSSPGYLLVASWFTWKLKKQTENKERPEKN